MNEYVLPVVIEDKCTACNACVEVCPKDLFSLHPVSHRLWVACKNLEAGDEILEDCEVACTACGRCAMDAPGRPGGHREQFTGDRLHTETTTPRNPSSGARRAPSSG